MQCYLETWTSLPSVYSDTATTSCFLYSLTPLSRTYTFIPVQSLNLLVFIPCRMHDVLCE